MLGDKLLFDSRGLDKYQKWNVRLLAYAIIFTIFSGAIRKWVVSSSALGNLFFLVQLFIPIFLIFCFKGVRLRYFSFFILFIYFVCLFLFALNPLNETIFHGIIGINLHGGLWVLLFIYFDNYKQFPAEKLIPLLVFFVLFEFLVTQWQYQMPYNHFINKYVGDASTQIATMSGRAVRVTGTFSFLSGFTAFLFCSSFLIWALSKLKYSKVITYILAGIVVLGSLQSGSRATFGTIFFIIGISMYVSIKNGNIVRNLVQMILLIFFIGTASYSQEVVRKGVSNFVYRFNGGLATNEYNSRTIGAIEEVINFRGVYPFVGIGLGSTYQGANAIWGESRYAKSYPGGYEEELERIVIEGGYILFFFKLLLLFILFFRSKIPQIFILGIIIMQIMTLPLVFNIYNAFFFFISIILVDRAYRVTEYQGSANSSLV